LVQSQSDFILELIQIDLLCHLEVIITQQGHFGEKSTVAVETAVKIPGLKSYENLRKLDG